LALDPIILKAIRDAVCAANQPTALADRLAAFFGTLTETRPGAGDQDASDRSIELLLDAVVLKAPGLATEDL
jgi:hypothetical protein